MAALGIVDLKSVHFKLCASAALREASLSHPTLCASIFIIQSSRRDAEARRFFLREDLLGGWLHTSMA
jgi:hypothetical protein